MYQQNVSGGVRVLVAEAMHCNTSLY